MQPLYTPDNVTPAYQLNWGLTIFSRQAPIPDNGWLAPLREATEPDGVRILKHHFTTGDTSQFFFSTKPHVSPSRMIWSVKGRLQKKPALHGSTFIDDTYNANPDSVKAALAVLAQQPGRKVLVLGDMGELGTDAAAMHAQIGLAARAADVDRLLALGELTKETVAAFGAGAMHFERIQELLAELENELTSDTTVLVKGSRFMQMERVVQSFMEGH